MQGLSSPEWTRYMRDDLKVPLDPREISDGVVAKMDRAYREHLPLVPGAVAAVRALDERWPLALASSANRELIDLVLELSGLAESFDATVSSEEVANGKPSPDVFLEAAGRLETPPERCVAIEDSGNGILAAHAAGMKVIAVPNPELPPAPHARSGRGRDRDDRGAQPRAGRAARLSSGDEAVWSSPLRGEDRLEVGLDAGLRRADDPLGLLAVLEQDHRRNREDLVARGGLLVLVHVDADDLEVVALGVHLLEDGCTTRHGPHQGAQKSTSTGLSESRTSDWKLASVTSVSLPGTFVSSGSGCRWCHITIQNEARLSAVIALTLAPAADGPHRGDPPDRLGEDRPAHLRVPLSAVAKHDQHLDDPEPAGSRDRSSRPGRRSPWR